jgi:hypothetical protein
LKSTHATICILGIVGLLAGCTTDNLPKTVPAEGIVTLDGAPVSDATVLFITETGNNSASGVSNKDGKFELRVFEEKKGAIPGAYKVTVSKTIVEPASERAGETSVNVKYGLPVRYSDLTKSGLTHSLGEQGDKNIKIELKSK